jgi:hypothetical protein
MFDNPVVSVQHLTGASHTLACDLRSALVIAVVGGGSAILLKPGKDTDSPGRAQS